MTAPTLERLEADISQLSPTKLSNQSPASTCYPSQPIVAVCASIEIVDPDSVR
jgi:hypothetical protein